MNHFVSHENRVIGYRDRLVQLVAVSIGCFLFSTTLFAAPTFVQRNSATPQSTTATVTVSYTAAETAGDLNVVVVGWNDTTATVQSVKDSAGNPYTLAIGPTSGTALRQSIYYASNILGGANTVTVTFSQAAVFPDVRILEYKGVNALDVTSGASGNSATTNSGAATTKVASELIFGANMVATTTSAAGSGFTSRVITSPDGDIAEDKVVTTTGSNSATATLSSGGPWVMQMATFSTISGPAPTVTSVSPNSGTTAGGTAVTITGTNFAAGATVTFGSTAASSVVVVSATTITAVTPTRKCRCVDSNGHRGRTERESDQRIHLYCPTDSNKRVARHGADDGWDGRDDLGDKLCLGSDGDVRRNCGDQCSSNEQHDDHGHHSCARGWCRSGDSD